MSISIFSNLPSRLWPSGRGVFWFCLQKYRVFIDAFAFCKACKRYNMHFVLGEFFLFAVDVVKMKGQDCFSEPLNPALVFLGVAMIGDAHKQQIVCVLCYFGGILLAMDLLDGGIDGLVVLQFDDDGG